MNESDLPDGTMIRDAGTIEENLPMVNYIMLHRIYDMLTLVAKGSVGSEEVERMVKYHEQGFLLGPEPAFTPSDIKDEVDGL